MDDLSRRLRKANPHEGQPLPEHAVNGLFHATVRLTVDSTGLKFTAAAQAKSKKTARSDAAERLLQKMIDGESDASDVAAM